jgi:isoleucyl-tRNA synthetase
MMINRKISVHLQDFPDTSFLKDETQLVADMDLIRSICSTALSIRDNKNLRVRLPLKSLTLIGKNAERILPFKDIIADEVNVKSLEIKEEISDLAELKLQINFKKIGAKYGSKIKEITSASKEGNWKKISDKEIEIAGVKLVDDEFELKLAIKNSDEKKSAILALPSNDYLVQLDIEITKDLEDEGIARDIVRAIQQNRKDADFNISDHINLTLFSDNSRLLEVAKIFENYIKEQVLCNQLILANSEFESSEQGHFFKNETEEGVLLSRLTKYEKQ